MSRPEQQPGLGHPADDRFETGQPEGGSENDMIGRGAPGRGLDAETHDSDGWSYDHASGIEGGRTTTGGFTYPAAAGNQPMAAPGAGEQPRRSAGSAPDDEDGFSWGTQAGAEGDYPTGLIRRISSDLPGEHGPSGHRAPGTADPAQFGSFGGPTPGPPFPQTQPSAPPVGPAAYPQSQASAGYPQSQPSAGYPQSQPSAGYPQSQPSAGYPQPEASVAHPRSYGSASLPQSGPSQAYAGPQFQPSAVRLNPVAEPPEPRRKKLSARVVAAAVIAVMAVTGVVLAGIGQFGRQPGVEASGTAREISDPAPPGWSRTMSWSRTLAMRPLVAVGHNRVAILDAAGRLEVLNADTGASLFLAQTGTDLSSARPFIAMAQGTKVVGLLNGAQLSLWPLDGSPNGEAKQLTLPSTAKLYQQGGGLMVVNRPTKENWVVTSAFTLAPVNLPGDHVALGATPDGFLISAPERGSWTFNPSNPGAQSRQVFPEQKPDGITGDLMVAWSSRGVVLGWGTTSDAGVRTVGLYEAETGKLKAQAKLSTDVVDSIKLTVSPDGRLAAAGPMLANLSDGQVQVTDRWSTIMSDSKNLYGTVDGQRMVWNGSGAPTAMEDKAVFPWGVSDQGLAIVMNQTSAGVLLGGLRPA